MDIDISVLRLLEREKELPFEVLAAAIEEHHAVLLAADGDRVRPVDQAVGGRLDRPQPGAGVDLGAGRVGCRP